VIISITPAINISILTNFLKKISRFKPPKILVGVYILFSIITAGNTLYGTLRAL